MNERNRKHISPGIASNYRGVTPFGQGFGPLLWQAKADRGDTVYFTCCSSGPKGVSPGLKALRPQSLKKTFINFIYL